MVKAKADIISQLRAEMLRLQGFRPATADIPMTGLPRVIQAAFPNSNFPLGVMHEFCCNSLEDTAASSAFITAIVSSLMKNATATVWITSSNNIFPPALKQFGVLPENIVLIRLKKEKEKLWALEEALKCDAISSVVAEINEFNFTESRRFQLAVENSKVTGFFLRYNPKNLATACVARWRIRSIASDKTELPGVGFPRWNVELLKARNGKPGEWQVEWRRKRFYLINNVVTPVVKEVPAMKEVPAIKEAERKIV